MIDYDIRERRNLASASRYKKNGSKSKRCTLPSDSLSEAKLRKMNGAIQVYQIGKPITWQEFKEYPEEMKRKYLSHFAEKFGCTSGMMAEMMGAQQSAVSVYLNRNGMSGILKRKAKMETIKRFSEWLTEQRTPVGEKAPAVQETKPSTAKRMIPQTMTSGTLHMEGRAGEILQQLFEIFGDQELAVAFSFEIKEREE